jgi:nucleoid-associated protein YgaU
LSSATIGIKIADGSFYPVLEHGFTGRKKLILTTVTDNQTKVKIDLYQGNGAALPKPRYIGSLVIENIPPAAKGEPEISLIMGVDENDQLFAEATDPRTGETQDLSTSLTALPETPAYETPDLVLEEEVARQQRRTGVNKFLLALFIVLGIALLGCIGFFLYKAVQGPKIPVAAAAQTAPAAAEQKPAAAEAKPAPAEAAPAPAPAETKQPAKPVTYRVKRGDTLWDISASYYRNPWLYPKIARANSIKNPDLILAGARIVIPEN